MKNEEKFIDCPIHEAHTNPWKTCGKWPIGDYGTAWDIGLQCDIVAF